jgi:hypothetical protein
MCDIYITQARHRCDNYVTKASEEREICVAFMQDMRVRSVPYVWHLRDMCE